MSILISASQCAPSACIDCGEYLHKSIHYGHIMGLFVHGSDKWKLATRFHYHRNHFKSCPCGALYVWSYDETNKNGGVWKRRHLLPLFDIDVVRLPIIERRG